MCFTQGGGCGIGVTGFGFQGNLTLIDQKGEGTGAPAVAIGVAPTTYTATGYYDKNGIQARVAYNWRDGFLSGYGFDPYYVEAYGQFDVSASWEFKKGLTAFVEGINITNEVQQDFVAEDEFRSYTDYGRTYSIGVRASF